MSESPGLKEFFFGPKEMALLGGLRYELLQKDINATKNGDKKNRKRQWGNIWKRNSEEALKTLSEGSVTSVPTDYSLTRAIQEFKVSDLFFTQSRLMLLELIIFVPYLPWSDSEKKKWKGLKFDSSIWKKGLSDAAQKLGLSSGLPTTYQDTLKSAVNGITNKWTKLALYSLGGGLAIAVTGGLAATAIAPFFAAAGLSGAAAISSGLAALGGGAIAAGGLGMAGGFTVIVGGGAILGSAVGASSYAIFSDSPETALYESAKMEVFVREVILQGQSDVAKAQQIITQQRDMANGLKKECDQLLINQKENKKKIKNLQLAIKYIERAVDRNNEAVSKAAD